MTTKQETSPDPKTFRAHVWSPLNNGEAILEMSVGTTVEEVLRTLSRLWGAEFEPKSGFAPLGGGMYVAGWCVLCKCKDERYYPLGFESIIPDAPIDPRDDEARYDAFADLGAIFGRVQRYYGHLISASMEQVRKRLNQLIGRHGKSFLTDFLGRFGDSRSHEPFPDGIVNIHALWRGSSREGHLLGSAPKPKEHVDVSLVVIIAVAGT